VPPFAQSANAEAIAGESSKVPFEEVYLEGITHVLPTVEFCAKTAAALKTIGRSSDSMLAATHDTSVRETVLSRRMIVFIRTPEIVLRLQTCVVLPHDADT
jgi:hypothetical protein